MSKYWDSVETASKADAKAMKHAALAANKAIASDLKQDKQIAKILAKQDKLLDKEDAKEYKRITSQQLSEYSSKSTVADWYQSRETLMSWFGVSTPILESDFYFKFQRFTRSLNNTVDGGELTVRAQQYFGNQNTDVSKQGAIEVGSHMINVKSISMPQVGVGFTNSPELLYALQPSIQVTPVQLTYYQRNRAEDVSSWVSMFALPYNSRGTLSIKSLSSKVDVEIGVIVGEKDVPLLLLKDCKFSYPTPNFDAQSNGLMTFSTTIAYNDYKVIENVSQNRIY